MRKTDSRFGRGFTLVELLVVVAIIGVLVGILVPVVGKMRQAGYKTDTANQLNVIRSAVEMYHQTFQAYPGPYSNQEISDGTKDGITGRNITMAENAVLGLFGGLVPPTKVGGAPLYNATFLGTGPRSLNPANPKRYEPFLSNQASMLSKDLFKETGTEMKSCNDSAVPEFVDRYPTEPMPILYLRARKGAPGIINAANAKEPYQYDIRQILPYTGGKIYGRDQGLNNAGNDMNAPLIKDGINDDALPYFRNFKLTQPGMTAKDGIPKSKDGYILISAGQDRIYGTMDDITSFGNVGE